MPVLQEVDRNKNILRLEDIIFPDLDSLDQVINRQRRGGETNLIWNYIIFFNIQKNELPRVWYNWYDRD